MEVLKKKDLLQSRTLVSNQAKHEEEAQNISKKVEISKSSWSSIIKEKRRQTPVTKAEDSAFVLDFGEDDAPKLVP